MSLRATTQCPWPLFYSSYFGHPTFLLRYPTTKVKGLKYLSSIVYYKKTVTRPYESLVHAFFFDIFSRFFFHHSFTLLPGSCSSWFTPLLHGSSSLLPHLLHGSWFTLVLLLCWFIFFQVSYSLFTVLLDSLFLLLVV